MIVEIDDRSPLPPYEQLRQQITSMITAGTLESGLRLPPIRQLAADLDLAPGTVARAYRELETDGLVVAGGRRGTHVARREDWARDVGADRAEARLRQAAERYATLARQLGVPAAEALSTVRRALDTTGRRSQDTTSPDQATAEA